MSHSERAEYCLAVVACSLFFRNSRRSDAHRGQKKKRNREPKSPTPELLRLLAAAAKKIYTIKTKSFLFEAAARRALFGVFFF